MSNQLLKIGLLLEHNVRLHSLQVVVHVGFLVELDQLVERLRELVEARLGRIVLARV